MAPASCAKRAVELVVCAPFNLTAKIFQAVLPLAGQVASRSWAQAGRVERELGGKVDQARFVGRFAVVAGGRQLRKEVDERLGVVRRRAEEAFQPRATPGPNGSAADTATGSTPETGDPGAVADAPIPARDPVRPATEAPAPPHPVPGAPPTTAEPALAIPDYDELSASQVTRRLAGLEPEELRRVRAYEASNRNRKTVLGAIDRLLA